MRKNIHPNYETKKVTCSCGMEAVVGSTYEKSEIHANVCSNCHPFYTGKTTGLATKGRAKRFAEKLAKSEAK